MSKKDRIPIDEFGEGNCCPACGSVKVHVYYQFPLYVCKDLDGNEKFRDHKTGKWTRRISNREKALLYTLSQCYAQMWNFRCERCGWISENFVP